MASKRQGRLSFGIARKPDVENVRWRPLPDGRRYVDNFSSPVIEVIRPFFDGKEMSRGRFYYHGTYFDERGRNVSKPDEFVTWAKSAFRVVKRGLSFDKTLPLPTYVAPEAKAWLRADEGFEITPNGRIVVKQPV